MLDSEITQKGANSAMVIHILLLTRDPAPGLSTLVQKLRLLFPVTIVSADETGSLCWLESAGATLLHPKGHGRRAALEAGLWHIANRGSADGVVAADMDGGYTVSDIVRAALSIELHPGTILLGRHVADARVERAFPFPRDAGRSKLWGIPAAFLNAAHVGGRQGFLSRLHRMVRRAPHLEIALESDPEEEPARPAGEGLLQGAGYALSSLCCTAVDYALYLFLVRLLPPGGSYAAARVCSSALNYFCNCKLVFRDRVTAASLAGYALLAGASLLVGATATAALTSCGLHEAFAKLLVDASLFFLNFLMQKKWIFPGKSWGAKRSAQRIPS